jgi:putative membrane protein
MNNSHHLLAAAVLGAALSFALPGIAQNNGSDLPGADVKFLQKAAEDGLAEVELGQLAQQKALRDEVRQFGKRMAEDHARANEQLKSVASAHHVSVPASLDRHHEREMNKLSQLIGGDFDRAYMSRMVSDHRKDVRAFRKRANAKTQTDVTRFAAATLPVLQSHLETARATNDIAQAPKRTGDRQTGSTKP